MPDLNLGGGIPCDDQLSDISVGDEMCPIFPQSSFLPVAAPFLLCSRSLVLWFSQSPFVPFSDDMGPGDGA